MGATEQFSTAASDTKWQSFASISPSVGGGGVDFTSNAKMPTGSFPGGEDGLLVLQLLYCL